MSLKLYNTLTRQKELFVPMAEGRVGMYVCGPTVYGHSHIGHAKSYVSFDVILRYLRSRGYAVTYIQNITDVGHLLGDANEGEDRLLKQGRLEQKHPMEIAEAYTRSYFEDMDALGILRPDIAPRATGHIIEQIELIRKLIGGGFAYEANGSVYFDVSRDAEYGKLSGRKTEEAESGTRVEVKSEKRQPEHIMRWPSPWGVGFPGWHIECSAMSMKYLGESFDIHGGGMDNQFPHHECEIAQSESVTGKPFVKYWIHNNLVTVGGRKMSKSLGNTMMLKETFRKYSPLVVRFFILQSHYRSTLDFTDEALEGASKGLEKLHQTVRGLRAELKKSASRPDPSAPPLDLAGARAAFYGAMDDDFNAPMAIAALFDLSREVNAGVAAGGFSIRTMGEIDAFFTETGGQVLGLIPERLEETGGADVEELMTVLLGVRQEVRANKLWKLSDAIRDGLAKLGFVVEDAKDGSTGWRRDR
jgi:cysteinyl-tRNA synthetase